MPRPPLEQDIVDEVEKTWAEHPVRSAAEVHRLLEKNFWPGYVGIRKVQEIIRLMKGRGAGRFEPTEWHPWMNPRETPEDADYLLELDRLNWANCRRHLFEHEAEWARRLRVVLGELELGGQWFLISEYGEREHLARNRQREAFSTADLDGLLTYKPWRQGRLEEYRVALERGDVEGLRFEQFFAVGPRSAGVASEPVFAGRLAGLSIRATAAVLWFIERDSPMLADALRRVLPSAEELSQALKRLSVPDVIDLMRQRGRIRALE